MSNPLFPASLGWDLLWQPTLWLLLGAAASRALAARPARAHRLLLLTLVAALVTPLLSQTARLQGWGLFVRPEPRAAVTPPAALTGLPPSGAADLLRELAVNTEGVPLVVAGPAAKVVPVAEVELPPEPPSAAGPADAPPVAVVFVLAWLVVSAALGLRLLVALVRCWRLLARAHPVEDLLLRQAAAEAGTRLGLRVTPVLYAADGVRSPMIWCWGRRPVLLLPPGAAGRRGVDWVAVFGHELAHWRRRDHRACLLAELVAAVLCWHPLAWWAKRRLALLCEQACDDWVLAGGTSPVSYAESLLRLLPQRRPGLAQAAVSSRCGLVRRLAHILARGRKKPRVGRAWAVLSTGLVWLAVAGLGLAQARTVTADEPPPPAAPQAAPAPAAPQAAAKKHVGGRVLRPDGAAAPGARVALVSWPQPPLWSETQVLAEARADDAGEFRLAWDWPGPEGVGRLGLLAAADGFGLGHTPWNPSAKDAKEPEVRLSPEQLVRGRLIDLQGQPAGGVRVHVGRVGPRTPARIHLNEMVTTVRTPAMVLDNELNHVRLWSSVARPTDSLIVTTGTDPRPAGALAALQYRNPPSRPVPWPGPATTDAQGRFTLRGIPAGQPVGVQVRDERYALQALTLGGTKDQAAEATHVLAPPRLVQGTVTDAATGKPVPGARLRVQPPSHYTAAVLLDIIVADGYHGADWRGRRGLGGGDGNDAIWFDYSASLGEPPGPELPPVEARADGQGRFRLHLFPADSYTIHVAADAPYLPRTKTVSWPKAAVVRQEVAVPLTRGVLVRGRVTEAGGGKAVAGARVDFWAKGLKLPEGVRRPQPAATGEDGGFWNLLPPGSWHLLVNAAAPEYAYQNIEATRLVNSPDGPAEANRAEGQTYFRPDGWLALDLKPGDAPRQVEVALRRAPLLRGRVVGPDGKTPAAVRMVYHASTPIPTGEAAATFLRRVSLDLTGDPNAWLRHWSLAPAPAKPGPAFVELKDGRFAVPAHDAEGAYQFFFFDAGGTLGAAARFPGKQAEGDAVTVRLAPTGSARARFVDAQGKPAADYAPRGRLVREPQPVTAAAAERHDLLIRHYFALTPDRRVAPVTVPLSDLDAARYGGLRTDAEGRVTLAGLIPGATYRLTGVQGGPRDFRVEAGQVIDLAEIRLPPPEQAPKK